MQNFAHAASIILLASLGLGLPSAALADDHSNIDGSWQLDTTKSQFGRSSVKSETISISEANGSVVFDDAVTGDNGKEEKVTYTCAPNGQACKAKHGGSEVTFYYNGALLVMIETRHGGDWVVKRRIQPSDDGKTLTVEVQRLAPPNQKNDSLVFLRH